MSARPSDGSVWAIGDIHGEEALLAALLDTIPRGPEDVTVFLGDAIDRGTDSAGVVRRLLAEYDAAPERTVLLWGNHEDLAAAHFGLESPCGQEYDEFFWFRNGGFETMASYGRRPPECFVARCPEELRRYLSLLRLFFRSADPALEGVIWVHAGVLPSQEPEQASPTTLLWVRDAFLDAAQPPGRLVVHGHTPAPRPRRGDGRIGIDTGAWQGGALTALRLPGGQFYSVSSRPAGTAFPR